MIAGYRELLAARLPSVADFDDDVYGLVCNLRKNQHINTENLLAEKEDKAQPILKRLTPPKESDGIIKGAKNKSPCDHGGHWECSENGMRWNCSWARIGPKYVCSANWMPLA